MPRGFGLFSSWSPSSLFFRAVRECWVVGDPEGGRSSAVRCCWPGLHHDPRYLGFSDLSPSSSVPPRQETLVWLTPPCFALAEWGALSFLGWLPRDPTESVPCCCPGLTLGGVQLREAGLFPKPTWKRGLVLLGWQPFPQTDPGFPLCHL